MISDSKLTTVVLDIDGTLVDTNYHHTIAWSRAFRAFDINVPIWLIHRHIGMGGDQLVRAVAGDEVDDRVGDEIRDREGELYLEMIDEVGALPHALELIVELKRRELTVVLASSAKSNEVDHYLDLLDARDLADRWTTSADVEKTKPAPDLIAAALDDTDPAVALMVGDSTWDCKSAQRLGVPMVAVLTGGFSAGELRDAGAAAVFRSLAELIGAWDRSPWTFDRTNRRSDQPTSAAP